MQMTIDPGPPRIPIPGTPEVSPVPSAYQLTHICLVLCDVLCSTPLFVHLKVRLIALGTYTV